MSKLISIIDEIIPNQEINQIRRIHYQFNKEINIFGHRTSHNTYMLTRVPISWEWIYKTHFPLTLIERLIFYDTERAIILTLTRVPIKWEWIHKTHFPLTLSHDKKPTSMGSKWSHSSYISSNHWKWKICLRSIQQSTVNKIYSEQIKKISANYWIFFVIQQ